MRVLVLSLAHQPDRKILINTANIVAVFEATPYESKIVAISTTDNGEAQVSNSLESIMQAWRFGVRHGTTEVFDAKSPI